LLLAENAMNAQWLCKESYLKRRLNHNV
jgi:hypothetical protein